MAVPKKRTGKSAQGHRRSNWKATKPETTICSNCGAIVLTHTVCTACGTYKGQPVSLKAKSSVPTETTVVEEVKEAAVETEVQTETTTEEATEDKE